jgi:hypothetical protein
VPFSKRYFLGGSDTLRGWGRLEVSPLSAAGLPIGGQSLAAASGELRLPVIGPLGAVGFVDVRNVWEKAWTLSSRLHADGGLGVRYRSPFGLLRFESRGSSPRFRGCGSTVSRGPAGGGYMQDSAMRSDASKGAVARVLWQTMGLCFLRAQEFDTEGGHASPNERPAFWSG